MITFPSTCLTAPPARKCNLELGLADSGVVLRPVDGVVLADDAARQAQEALAHPEGDAPVREDPDRRGELTAGEVDQRRQVALNNRQISNGYIILCVARPLSDITLEIGVESHDKLYRNPFLDPLEPHELKADIATPKET